eukprot:14809664-Heterocapsa_arctica.AAC.1
MTASNSNVSRPPTMFRGSSGRNALKFEALRTGPLPLLVSTPPRERPSLKMLEVDGSGSVRDRRDLVCL